MIVRRATTADAEGIARVHVAAWQESYAHLLSAELLAGLDAPRRAARWQQIIDLGETDVWVAIDHEIIGWATASAGRDEDSPRPLELEGIYLLASHYGSGQALLDAAIGDSPAYLWVAEDNPRARAFYERNGFVADGARTTHPVGSESLDAIRMVR